MAKVWRFIVFAVIFMLPIAIVFTGEPAESAPDALEIVCQIDSVSIGTSPGEFVLNVMVENFSDSIAGVTLWFNISDPEFVKFALDTVVDTTWYPKFDTSGTLLSGFESVSARIRDGANRGLFSLAATYDDGFPPIATPPIAPQSGVKPLVKLILEVQPNLGDSLCIDSLDLDETIYINDIETRFSDPYNNLIGYTCLPLSYDTLFSNCAEFIVIDTTFENCVDSVMGECVNWEDTTYVTQCINWFDTTYLPVFECNYDSSKILYTDGRITWSCGLCGDADGSGAWSIGDAVFIINYIFGGGPPPNPLSNGDADGSGAISIGDAVYLINFIFGGGPPPPSSC